MRNVTKVSLESRLSARRVFIDGAFRFFLLISITAALGFIFLIVFRLWRNAGWLLSWDLVKNFPSYDIDSAGFQSSIMGSIWVVGVATLIALPIGALTALYSKSCRRSSGCFRFNWFSVYRPWSIELGIYRGLCGVGDRNADSSGDNYYYP
jgi:ABC-type phosphate transport system permease subunit